MAKICGKCGAQMNDGAKFCTNCGAKAEAPAAQGGMAMGGGMSNAGNQPPAAQQEAYVDYFANSAGQPPMQQGHNPGQPPMQPGAGSSMGQPSMPQGNNMDRPPMQQGRNLGQPPMQSGAGISMGQPPMQQGNNMDRPPMQQGRSLGQPPMQPSAGSNMGQQPMQFGGNRPPVQAGIGMGQPSMPAGGNMGQPPMQPGNPMGGGQTMWAYVPDQGIKEMFLRYDGRLNRKPYILRGLGLGAISLAVLGISAVLDMAVLQILSSLVSLAILVPSMMLNIRRLHDLGYTGWYSLGLFIPVVGFILGLFLCFKKGTDGPNQYGPDPLGGRW